MKADTFLYELLIRFSPDGFQGAHAKDIARMTDDDGKVVSDTELPPRPVTEAEFRKLLGAQNAKLTEAAQKANHDRAVAEAAREKAEAQQSKTAGELATAVHRIDQANADCALAREERVKAERIAEAAVAAAQNMETQRDKAVAELKKIKSTKKPAR